MPECGARAPCLRVRKASHQSDWCQRRLPGGDSHLASKALIAKSRAFAHLVRYRRTYPARMPRGSSWRWTADSIGVASCPSLAFLATPAGLSPTADQPSTGRPSETARSCGPVKSPLYPLASPSRAARAILQVHTTETPNHL